MKAFVGVSDNEWFAYLSSLLDIDEVNFWQRCQDGGFLVAASWGSVSSCFLAEPREKVGKGLGSGLFS